MNTTPPFQRQKAFSDSPFTSQSNSNRIIPRRLVLMAAMTACSLAIVTNTQAALLVYDGFETPGDYTVDSTINGISGGTGDWTSSWAVGGGTINAVENSIPVTGLVQSPGKISTNPDTDTAANVRRQFDGTAFDALGSEVWFSYAYSREAGSNNHNVFITGDGSATRYFGLRSENATSSEVNATLRFSGSTVEKSAASISLVNGEDYFIIGRMTFEPEVGVFARLDVWSNPMDFSSVGALGAADMFVQTTNVYDSGFSDVWIQNGANASYEFDEIRIGSTLANVTPVPEPTVAILVGLTGLAVLVFRRRLAVR